MILRLILMAVYILFFGCSGYIGTDWYNYNTYFESTTLFEWSVNDYEIGFSLITKIFSYLGFSFASLKLFIICIQAVLLDRVLSRYSPNISLSYVILISSFTIVVVDLLRNFTAILIASQAFTYFSSKKTAKAYLILLISICFHTSCIVYFAILPFFGKKIGIKTIYFLLALGLFIYLFQIAYIKSILAFLGNLAGGRIEFIISRNLETTMSESTALYGLKIGILEKLFFILLVLRKYKYLFTTFKSEVNYISNFFIVFVLIYLYFSEMEVLINRFSILFAFGYIIIIPKLIHSYNNKSNWLIIVFLSTSLFVVKTAITYNFAIYKYSNIIFTTDSLSERFYNRIVHYE